MSDRKTIGVTQQVAETLRDFVDRSEFNDEVDAARMAVMVALRSGKDPGEVSGATTKWNVGSFDPSGELRTAIRVLRPDVTEPYRYMECLLHDGAVYLSEHLKTFDGLDLEALLSSGLDSEQSAAG